MIRAVESALVAFGVLLFTVPLSEFIWAWRKRSLGFLRAALCHVRLQLISGRYWVPLLSTAAILFLPFSTAFEVPAVVVFTLCIWVSTMLRWATPPTVLLLGASGGTANELLIPLPAVFPARIIHLLKDKYNDPSRGFDLKLHTLFSHSRTSGSVSWEFVVTQYLELCEHTLVDLRAQSQHLERELLMISGSPIDIREKVLYLVTKAQLEDRPEAYRRYAGRLCLSPDEAIRRLRRGK